MVARKEAKRSIKTQLKEVKNDSLKRSLRIDSKINRG
jgi:hypothetical protein